MVRVAAALLQIIPGVVLPNILDRLDSFATPIRLWWPVVLLGIATIGSYGTVYYAIGVLIPVISADTGWGIGVLSGGFSIAVLGQGGIAVAAGRLLDRHGSRSVLIPSLIVGTAALLLSSVARDAWQFALAWSLGGAAIGGSLFYNVTMPITARLFRDRRASAFSLLTLFGALASPIFYPMAGWMTGAWGWRGALQGLICLMVLCVLPAATLVRAPAEPSNAASPPMRRLGDVLSQPRVQMSLVIFGCAALANSALLLHQVPALQAAGLSLAAATSYAGARGAFQIPGRLLLAPLTHRFGIRRSICICYLAAASAALALGIAIELDLTTVSVLYFTVVSGMSLGLLSPLNGLFQTETFQERDWGMLSGVTVLVTSLASAAGATLSGLAVDVTGRYTPGLLAIGVLQIIAVLLLIVQERAHEPSPALGIRSRVVAPVDSRPGRTAKRPV